ncbi:MAG: hypothetical protein KDK91_21155, partial [Gammaproteobacteria bacterium]|nr:hypothetical protein [Gammaproteobacteria bacterium]
MQAPSGSEPDSSDAASDPTSRVRRLLNSIAWRWWRRRLLEGMSLAALFIVLLLAALCAYMIGSRFEPAAVQWARQLGYVLVPALLVLLLAPRLVRRMSSLNAARHAEARGLGQDAMLVSAAELLGVRRAREEGESVTPGSLQHALLTRAAGLAEREPRLRLLERPRTRRAGLLLLALLLCSVVAILGGPTPVRHALALLAAPERDPAVENPFRLQVEPGDIQIVAGDDQAITASSFGFAPARINLMVRRDGETDWQPLSMSGSAGATAAGVADEEPPQARYEHLLFDLGTGLDYYVKSGPIESSRHRIDVLPRPRVTRIDVLYEYPPHTGRTAHLAREQPEIRGLRGATVELRLLAEGLPAADSETEASAGEIGPGSAGFSNGALLLDGQQRLPLEREGDWLRARLTLENDGRYRIELPLAGGRTPRTLVAASAEHGITVLDDQLPVVRLEAPGRDARVSPIEEIALTVEAEDDVALREVSLVLNVNGEHEQIVPVAIDSVDPTQTRHSHRLALEELSLAPGDLISYHVRASDATGDSSRQVSSDIYFLDVRPFERSFRRARGGGGGGGG